MGTRADKGWHRTFADLIPLPDGGELRTLRDAGNLIARLPKQEHDAPEWLAAIKALMLVVEQWGQHVGAHWYHAGTSSHACWHVCDDPDP
jgi:hypothetical protein